MSLQFNFDDLFEIELEIYNSGQRLLEWCSNELEDYQKDKQVRYSIQRAYKKLSINL